MTNPGYEPARQVCHLWKNTPARISVLHFLLPVD